MDTQIEKKDKNDTDKRQHCSTESSTMESVHNINTQTRPLSLGQQQRGMHG